MKILRSPAPPTVGPAVPLRPLSTEGQSRSAPGRVQSNGQTGASGSASDAANAALPATAVELFDFSDPSKLQLAKQYLEEVIVESDEQRAYAFVWNIDRYLRQRQNYAKEQPSLYQSYLALYQQARWLALPQLRKKAEVVSLFESSVTALLPLLPDFPLLRRFQDCLLWLVLPEERDEWKKAVREALARNGEQLTATKLKLESAEQPVPGTVANWVKDYVSQVGPGQVERLPQAQYFQNSPNFSKLPEVEKLHVRTILSFYEAIKRSSLTPEGVEERFSFVWDGQRYAVRDGQIVAEDLPTLDAKTRAVLAKAFPGEFGEATIKVAATSAVKSPLASPLEKGGGRQMQEALQRLYAKAQVAREGLGPEMEKLRKQVISTPPPLAPPLKGGDSGIGKLQEVLERALAEKQVGAAVAAMHLLAGKSPQALLVATGKSPEIVSVDRKQLPSPPLEKGGLEDYLLQRFGQAAQALARPLAGGPGAVSAWLQWALQEQLGLAEADASLWGVSIANALLTTGAKEYLPMVYADPQAGRFRWTGLTVAGGKVILQGI